MLQWNLCIVDAPEDGTLSQCTICFVCRVTKHGRVFTTRRSSRSLVGSHSVVPTSTCFENPASREARPWLVNSNELFLCTECGRFLDAWSNKSEASCLVVLSQSLVKCSNLLSEKRYLLYHVVHDTMSGLLCGYWTNCWHDGIATMDWNFPFSFTFEHASRRWE